MQPLAHWTIVWHMVSEYVVHYLLSKFERARTQHPPLPCSLVSSYPEALIILYRRGHYDVGANAALRPDPCGVLPWFRACFLMRLRVLRDFLLFLQVPRFLWVCEYKTVVNSHAPGLQILQTPCSSVSGMMILGHNRSRSQCFQVQPVPCVTYSGVSLVNGVYSLDSSAMMGTFHEAFHFDFVISQAPSVHL